MRSGKARQVVEAEPVSGASLVAVSELQDFFGCGSANAAGGIISCRGQVSREVVARVVEDPLWAALCSHGRSRSAAPRMLASTSNSTAPLATSNAVPRALTMAYAGMILRAAHASGRVVRVVVIHQELPGLT